MVTSDMGMLENQKPQGVKKQAKKSRKIKGIL